MKTIVKILLVVAFFSSSEEALACTCNLPPPPCYEYWRKGASAVFVGTVKEVRQRENALFTDVRLQVDENFRGMNTSIAHTFNYGHSCAFNFKSGQKYVFWGSLTGENPFEFGTSYCSRTALFNEDSADLRYLRSVKDGKSLFWIWGTLSETGFETPLKGIRAEVKGQKKALSGVSDDSGNLLIEVPGPGVYLVRVFLPEGRTDINFVSRSEIGLWEENQKKIVGRKINGDRPYVDFQLNVEANRCGWFDVSIPNSSN